MGRNARLRKLRREALRRQVRDNKSVADWAAHYQAEHPEALVLCGGQPEKMSEVLEDFAEPLLREATTPDQMKHALTIAMLAWNWALLDKAERLDSDLPEMKLDPQARRALEALAARKQALYPHNKRMILDFQLIPNGNHSQLNVISTPAPF